MAKIKSFGADVYLNGIAVGGLTDITTSGTDVSFIETTSHDAAGGFGTFLSGLKDGGTLELTGKYNYADAGQAEWKAEEGVSHIFQIILSDNSGFTFRAIVGGFQTSNPLDDAVEFTATAKITGEVFPVFPTMAITGTLTSDGSTPLVFADLPLLNPSAGKKIQYYNVSESTTISWHISNQWRISTGLTVLYHSNEDVLTPDEVVTWTANAPATGTPVVTGE